MNIQEKYSWALMNDDVESLKKLVDGKPIDNIYIEFGQQFFPLVFKAVSYSSKKCLEMILENGGDPDHCCAGEGPWDTMLTPFMLAVVSGDIKIAEILLLKGADFSKKPSNNKSASQLSSTTEMKKFLKRKGIP